MKANWRNVLGAFAVVATVGAPAAAGPLEDGDAAYHEKAYAKAAELWQPLAEKGDAAAQYSLGTLYAEGKGVERNDATAFLWFQRAANRGHAAAQYNVGASYAVGAGVDQSDADAAKWFQRAANQGMVFAQLNLGLLYASGTGVPQDNVEAFKWLELAFFALPAGGPRMDVANAMKDISAKLTRDQLIEAKQRERAWKAEPEAEVTRIPSRQSPGAIMADSGRQGYGGASADDSKRWRGKTQADRQVIEFSPSSRIPQP